MYRALSVVTLILLALTANAATINVPGGQSIQTAIDQAVDGDVIQLTGAYYPGRLVCAGKRLTIRGADLINGVPTTVIGGNEEGSTITITGAGVGRDMVLERLRVVHGRADEGGGIYVNGASPTIRDCKIDLNWAQYYGGGIYAINSSLLVENCRFDSIGTLTTSGIGGAIYCRYGSPVIRSCHITKTGAYACGGAIAAQDCSDLSIKGNLIETIDADRGGGIWSSHNTGSIVGNTIRLSKNPSVAGGGICSEFKDDVDIYGNVITQTGALTGSAITIEDQCTTSLRSNLIVDNLNVTTAVPPPGTAAVRILNSTCQVIGNTIASNRGAATSSGVWCCAGSDVTLRNNIIAFNRGYGISVTDGGVARAAYNCIYDNAAGGYDGLGDRTGINGNFSLNPQFFSAATGDYHLKSCNGRYDPVTQAWAKDNVTSPCIDAGGVPGSYASEPLPNGNRVNMGAYGNTEQASKSSMLLTRDPGLATKDWPRHRALVIKFRKPVKPDTVASRLLVKPEGGSPIAGGLNWTRANFDLRFVPDAPLAANTNYIVNFAPGIEPLTGPAYSWQEFWKFRTGSGPAVTAYSPTGFITSLPQIQVTFDQAMAKTSVQSNFSILPALGGIFSWSGRTMTYTVTESVPPATFTVTIGASAKSAAGVKLGSPFVWSFEVGPIPDAFAMAASAATRNQLSTLTLNLSTAATVTTRILNLAGREVAVLPEQSLPSGVSTLFWNGASKSNTKVPPGRYLAMIQARTTAGAQVRAVCPLMR